MRKLIFLFVVCPKFSLAATCPSGMIAVEYDTFVPAVAGACPSGTVAHNVLDVCSDEMTGTCWLVRMLCAAGITALNTSGGLSFPLYSDKSTSPSLHILYNNTICYGDMASGVAADAININYNGNVYHVVK